MLDYQVTNLIYLTSDHLVKSFNHTFLVHMTMEDNRKPLLINQVQLVKSSLNLFILIQPCIPHDSQRRYLDLNW